ncbi:MAG: cupin domain-containing protein [Burkholderiales bacterium]|nr:cupin domain-containing protein [Burkholderiales bacterium]
MGLHADRTLPALVHAARLPWLASPQRGVERRMLERVGGEVALATSIVRYAPGSRFPGHVHDLGEEFLVLEGTFSDEHGHYPAGSYVRNPPGSSHHPFSEAGCVIFVKLRQMNPAQSRRVVHAGAAPGERLLYADAHETVRMERLEPGCTIPARRVSGGQELLVVEGSARLAGEAPQALQAWSWLRSAGTDQTALESATGALLWIKQGHLG